jgi:hypothetical protein
MKRSTTFLLATFAAIALSACGPRRTDTTTGEAKPGATGATGGAYDTSSATGTMGDSTHVKSDSTAR